MVSLLELLVAPTGWEYDGEELLLELGGVVLLVVELGGFVDGVVLDGEVLLGLLFIVP